MKYFFCLVPKENAKSATNIGRCYAYANRSSWIEDTELSTYLTAGYVKGTDFVVHEGKSYMIMKTFLDLDEKFAVILATESTMGCDVE